MSDSKLVPVSAPAAPAHAAAVDDSWITLAEKGSHGPSAPSIPKPPAAEVSDWGAWDEHASAQAAEEIKTHKGAAGNHPTPATQTPKAPVLAAPYVGTGTMADLVDPLHPSHAAPKLTVTATTPAAAVVREPKGPWAARFGNGIEAGYEALRYGHFDGSVIGKSGGVGAAIGAVGGAGHQGLRATGWAAKTAAKGGLIGVAALGGAALLARSEFER